MSKLNDAVALGLLRKYNLATAQVGDAVLGFDPGKVIAIHCGRVVFGWAKGNVNSFTEQDDPSIYLAPLAWVEDRPVYLGDVLYIKARVDRPTAYRVIAVDKDGFIWDEDGNQLMNTDLTWTKPTSTIKINGHDVPAPERVAPPVKTMYWVPNIESHVSCVSYWWGNDDFDARCLSRGLVHLIEEAAVAHAKALLSFTEVCDV